MIVYRLFLFFYIELIPVSSRDNSGLLGLGLGLGLPLLAAFTGLAFYNFCQKQCTSLGYIINSMRKF
jgi:hypothetical protein